MGWLRYTRAEALATNIYDLERALEAFVELQGLRQHNQFVLPDRLPSQPATKPPPEAILAAFRRAAAPKNQKGTRRG